jgi:hypothetical protein
MQQPMPQQMPPQMDMPPVPQMQGAYDPNEPMNVPFGLKMNRGQVDYMKDLGAGIGKAFDNPVVQALSYANERKDQRRAYDREGANEQFKNEIELFKLRKELGPEYTFEEIYTEDGKKQKALVNKATGDVRHVGGAMSDEQKKPSGVQEYEYYIGQLKSRGVPEKDLPTLAQYDQSNRAAGASRSTNIVNNAPGQNDAQWGEPEKGFVWARGNDGKVLTRPIPGMDGAYQPISVPIGGGKEDAGRADADAKADQAKTNQQRSSDIVIGAIDKALSDVGVVSAGYVGQKMRDMGGTPAFNLNQTIQTVKANVAFGELQRMREASPTGGALGAVSEGEMALLQSVMGALDTAQSPAQLKENLQKLKEVYGEIRRKFDAYPKAGGAATGEWKVLGVE